MALPVTGAAVINFLMIIFCCLLPAIAFAAPAMLQIAGQGEIAVPSATDYTDDANCQGAWLMNTDGGSEPDVSGNGATLLESGTAARTTTTPSGYNGYSRFLLNASGYLSHADGLSTDIYGADQQVTAAAWIRADEIPNDKHFISKGSISAGDRSIWLYIENSDSTIRALISNNGTDYGLAISSTAVSALTWYHVAVVYNDTDIRIYINGSLDSNGANNPLAYTDGVYNSSIGFAVGLCGGYNFDGEIDEVIIFDRALSAAEILEIYTDGITGDNGGSD